MKWGRVLELKRNKLGQILQNSNITLRKSSRAPKNGWECGKISQRITKKAIHVFL